ncbi:hypothetical protein ACIQXU_16510 [Peribacillus sp. NPDC097284]|uniref:hypothetical protein n=1 Tax=Peribacillus sp. NPDC097284 TaxID=3364401 RepID=UPI00382F169C
MKKYFILLIILILFITGCTTKKDNLKNFLDKQFTPILDKTTFNVQNYNEKYIFNSFNEKLENNNFDNNIKEYTLKITKEIQSVKNIKLPENIEDDNKKELKRIKNEFIKGLKDNITRVKKLKNTLSKNKELTQQQYLELKFDLDKPITATNSEYILFLQSKEIIKKDKKIDLYDDPTSNEHNHSDNNGDTNQDEHNHSDDNGDTNQDEHNHSDNNGDTNQDEQLKQNDSTL